MMSQKRIMHDVMNELNRQMGWPFQKTKEERLKKMPEEEQANQVLLLS